MSDPLQEQAFRKKLIFFASADPKVDPDPAWSAYHFAKTAANAGLDAEVRLAGDAVRLARPNYADNSQKGRDLFLKATDLTDRSHVVSY